jgi:hypothetical protein
VKERAMHHGHHDEDHHAQPSGLAASAAGLTLEVSWHPEGATEEIGTLRFRILDADGRPVRDFDEQHERAMHLMVVRRDLSHYQHLHPTMDPGGTWSTSLTLPGPGDYRIFADFVASGEALTLGRNLSVPGGYEPVPLPDPTDTVRVADYEVALDTGGAADESRLLVFRVSRDGRPLDDLEPYLGALGHLVALRKGDLAFLHVHPEDYAGAAGPEISFHATFPSEGRYRLFLQFAHAGKVHTAAFTLTV